MIRVTIIARVVARALGVALVLASRTDAQEPVLIPTTPSAGFESFQGLWEDYLRAEESGDATGMERALSRIQQIRVERTAREVRDLALAFSYRAQAHLERGELPQADLWLNRALALDPGLPTPHFGLGQVARARGGIGYLGFVTETARGYVTALRDTFTRTTVLWVAAVSGFVVILVYSLLLLYRYAVLVSHDFAERVQGRFGGWTAAALTVGTLLLPLVFSLGPGWLPFYWIAVTFAYQGRLERVLSGAALAFLAAAAPLAEWNALFTRMWLNPLYRASMSSTAGTTLPSDVRLLEATVAANPGDRDLEFLLAALVKGLGDYDRAAALYRKILERRADDVGVRINLGNIYYAQHDFDGAKLEYRKAIAADSRSALAFYNLSQVHAVNFEFKERDVARGSAESLDRDRVSEWAELEYPGISDGGGGEAGTGVVDVSLSASEVAAKFIGIPEGYHPTRVSISVLSLVRGRGARFWIGAVVLLALIGIGESALRFRALTQRCWKCASPFCGRCQIGTGRRGLCTQCYHLFVTKDGVSAAARNEKITRVQAASRRRRLIFRALSVVAPGAGHLAEGRPLLGAPLLSLWVFTWTLVVAGAELFPRADAVMSFGEAGLGTALAGVVLAAGLAVSNTVAQPPLRG